ncbi:hypothetical protein [Pseudomonas sp. PDM19]|uniref:hypothetical protein n=1 Tax=Pseudomonas sp. PDM19 TaxID=2769272 RepID=UPI00177CCF9D|nr:hypothetical protein [Pseudomonas sp. PDM19]MBD9629737.1 hypothetical protein [Pseudomonas sp. PDM19]
MLIKLSPSRSDDKLIIVRDGEALTINGQVLNFGGIGEGETVSAESLECPWINQPVSRIDGEIVLTLIMPYGLLAGDQSKFPADIVDPPDGPVELPTDQDPVVPEFL